MTMILHLLFFMLSIKCYQSSEVDYQNQLAILLVNCIVVPIVGPKCVGVVGVLAFLVQPYNI